jgi:hypothetical protein
LFTRARYWLYPSHALPSCFSTQNVTSDVAVA